MFLGLLRFKIALQKGQLRTKGQIKLGPVSAKPLQLLVMAVDARPVHTNALGHTQLNESSLAHHPSFVAVPSALAARSTVLTLAVWNNELENLLVLGNDVRLLHEAVSVGILAQMQLALSVFQTQLQNPNLSVAMRNLPDRRLGWR